MKVDRELLLMLASKLLEISQETTDNDTKRELEDLIDVIIKSV